MKISDTHRIGGCPHQVVFTSPSTPLHLLHGDQLRLVESWTSQESRELMVGRAPVDAGKPTLPVRLLNLSDEPWTIRGGAIVIKCGVEEVTGGGRSTGLPTQPCKGQNYGGNYWPEGVMDMVTHSEEGRTSEHENGSRVCEKANWLGFLAHETEIRYPGSYTPFSSRTPYLALLAPEEKGCVSKTYLILEGPGVVLRQVTDMVFKIQMGPHTLPQVVHGDRLTHYQGRRLLGGSEGCDKR